MKLPSSHTVLITAGGSGIGLAIAERFLANGARVHICDVSEQALSAAMDANPGLTGSAADVSCPDSVAALFDEALTLFGGRLDTLVNNAGIGGPTAAVEDISCDEWQRVFNVNVNGMFYCVRQAVPVMKRQQQGCIINISTVNARIGLPLRTPYVASKAAVLGLTDNLARELGPAQIRCNAILPGPVDNPRGRALIAAKAEQHKQSLQQAETEFVRYISLRTLIDSDAIGNMAVFLASEAGSYISGQHIGVCGNTEWEQ